MKRVINFGGIWRRLLKGIGWYEQWLFWREEHLPTNQMKQMCKFYAGFVQENNLCFDIGANMGSRVTNFVILKARVIAVEPQRMCYSILQKVFKHKNVVVVPKGAGAINEIKDFYVADDSLISSFSTDWIEDQKSGRFKNNNWNKVEKIEIVTLDMLIQQYGIPDFIKIDTEGFELEVLKGLSQPVKALSFEYTLPDQKDKAIACIAAIDLLYKGKAVFNICRDEIYSMHLNEWLPANDIIERIKSDDFNVDNFGFYGDVYAKAVSLNQ